MTTAKPETDPTHRQQQPLSIDTSAQTSSTPAVINDPGIVPSISPTSDQRPARGAERAMSSTSNWKPALDRRQSFSQQEYSHEFHQKLAEEHDRRGSFGSSQGIGAGGFTERG